MDFIQSLIRNFMKLSNCFDGINFNNVFKGLITLLLENNNKKYVPV